MSKIYNSVVELVGNTPLVRLKNIEKAYGLGAQILAKIEAFNPAGSAKDRVAKKMIEDAEKKGLIGKGSVIIEPTSGNTGIGLAAIGVSRGYRVIIVMPDTMSAERIALIKAFGAEVILTDGKKGMSGAIEKANEIANETEGAFIAGQFENPSNPDAHYETTGKEIYDDTDGEVDIFVACIGTGGTITGTGRYLKEQIPSIKVVAVEPEASPLLSKGVSGPHKIQGIGANFIPNVLDMTVCDDIVTVSDDDAMFYAVECARKEGVLVGISSGAALSAAITIASKEENQNKKIVVFLPDTGERYLSTGVFN